MARDVRNALPDPTPPQGSVSTADPSTTTTQADAERRLRRLRDTGRADRARSTAYRSRFVLVYFALAIALGAAVGALVVALDSPKSTPAKKAATFKPSSSGEIGAQQIANKVQSLYRLSNDMPLAVVIASRNSLQDGSFGFLRVRFQVIQQADAKYLKDRRTLFPDDAIQYSLCGDGAACAIPGAATPVRGALLRREGLELALRTFDRDPGVDNVVVFLRPFGVPDNWEGVALMFDRATMTRNSPNLLSRPVTDTLPGYGKKLNPTSLTETEVARIRELTQPYLFVYRYQTLGGRDAVMYLEPIG